MKQLLKYELDVRLFKYKSAKEREKHVEKMQSNGWSIKREGQAMLLSDSTVSERRDKSNWNYIVEFYKEKKTEGDTKGIEYETDLYWTSIYNPRT